MNIKQNLQQIKQSCAAAAQRSGRAPEAVKIVAVSKTVDNERIRELADAGHTVFGENWVQEVVAKQAVLGLDLEWHFIGYLQRNKVRQLVGRVALIHSLDRWSLAEEINRCAVKADLEIAVLVQVNVTGEESKSGINPDETQSFLRELAGFPLVRVEGLMTMAPYSVNPEQSRPIFRELRVIRDEARQKLGLKLPHLSMGMSGDYLVAVEEGADIIRVGTAIFGQRTCHLRGV
ncbi:MAG: YggS family pyridoxal phosphate-dependent enzyme [Firmicutes bacterium]|jgi:pyridoxal phosphate enzyme (YggS family)|nr:YggS family pyridoxal phosphate-dependent enzyme [Bacillota bacterium]MBU4533996.1 YggS family pyridoxal phosphate-dependent enzyme [Bacillota bacterium]MBV1726952.1 YggS family pyridoxal phosphate-dependent enzyme [Desulforudis sp.]MBV1734814.1 YggS family pyridoxal phosphate-dependent enzyme [Desulforudis sp.]